MVISCDQENWGRSYFGGEYRVFSFHRVRDVCLTRKWKVQKIHELGAQGEGAIEIIRVACKKMAYGAPCTRHGNGHDHPREELEQQREVARGLSSGSLQHSEAKRRGRT